MTINTLYFTLRQPRFSFKRKRMSLHTQSVCVCVCVCFPRLGYLLVSYGAYLSGSTCRQRWKKRTCRSRRKSSCSWSKSAIVAQEKHGRRAASASAAQTRGKIRVPAAALILSSQWITNRRVVMYKTVKCSEPARLSTQLYLKKSHHSKLF